MAVLLFQASLSFGKLLTCQVPVDAANCVILEQLLLDGCALLWYMLG